MKSLGDGLRRYVESGKIAADDHRGGAIVYEAVLHARRSKQGGRGFHGECFVAQGGQPLALAQEHRFFHLVPVDRRRGTGRYFGRGPVKVIN